jgi:hypothetical protein
MDAVMNSFAFSPLEGIRLFIDDFLSKKSPDIAAMVAADAERARLAAIALLRARLVENYRLIENEALRPVFEAKSRADYWSLRDQLFMAGELWPSRVFAVFEDIEKLDGPAASPPVEIKDIIQLAMDPPAFLSERARMHIAKGLRYHEQIISMVHEAVKKQVEPSIHGNPPRVDVPERMSRINASIVLFQVWVGELLHGRRPASDDVADSIAQNFANVMGGAVGMLAISAAGGVDEFCKAQQK